MDNFFGFAWFAPLCGFVWTHFHCIKMKFRSKTIFSVAYKFACILCFCYQGHKCIDEYINQNTTTKTYNVDQESFPTPKICLTTYKFEFVKKNFSKDDFDKYIAGDWKLNFKNEEEAFERLTPKLHEIISKIKIGEYVQQIGDSFKYKVFDINEDSDFEKLGFEVTRKDYWSKLKAFCFHYRLTER